MPPWGPPPGQGWQPADPYWTPRPPRRSSVSVIITSLLLAVAVIAGVGIGHLLPRSSFRASAGGGATAPASPTPGAGSGGNPGSSPFGSGGSGSGSGSGGNFFSPGAPTGSGNGAGSPSDVAAIAHKIDPAIVDVATQLSFVGEEAFGTGIVLTSKGLILTNNHVINGATQIHVTDIGNGKTYTAKVVGYDESKDIALLQLVGASGLTTARLGNSNSVSKHEPVVAVGNAGGVGGTPSAVGGEVIGINQSITASDESDGTSEHLHGLIETNAPIQSGDSGGALVNTKGLVLGVDTAANSGFTFDNGNVGVQGFTIPINQAMTLVGEIGAGHGSSSVHIGQTAFLGVAFEPAALKSSHTVVSEIVPGTAAQRAGLKAGDEITTFGGKPVGSPGDLTTLLIPYHPGDKVAIVWTTPAHKTQRATVTLTNGPAA